MKFEVGQTLFMASWNSREIVVHSVGRKWVTFDGGTMRFDKATMRTDNALRAGVYLSKADYESQVVLHNKWLAFRREIERYYSPPAKMTLEKIDELRRLIAPEPCACARGPADTGSGSDGA